MPPIPETPDNIERLLWIALYIIVPVLSAIVVYFFRTNQTQRDQHKKELAEQREQFDKSLKELRDQREKDLREALENEKLESRRQQDLLNRNTDTLDLILEELVKKTTKETPREPFKKGVR